MEVLTFTPAAPGLAEGLEYVTLAEQVSSAAVGLHLLGLSRQILLISPLFPSIKIFIKPIFFPYSFPHFSTPLDSNFVRHTCSMRPASSRSSSLVEVSPEHRLGHRTREAKTRPRPRFENRGKINVLSQLELWYYYAYFFIFHN